MPKTRGGAGLARGGRLDRCRSEAAGEPDVAGWVRAAGGLGRQFLHLDAVPNDFLPQVLREMDAALFTNRCEGGTNLMAMERMVCGAPTVLSAKTGRLGLIAEDNYYPLLAQAPLGGIHAAVGVVAGRNATVLLVFGLWALSIIAEATRQLRPIRNN